MRNGKDAGRFDLRGRGGARLVAISIVSAAIVLTASAFASTASLEADEALVAPGTATAVQCDNWYRPVLCRIEFRGAREDDNWGELDPNRTIELAPGGRLRVEVLGWDQDGRSFPDYRMGFGHDAEDCTGVLEFEERDEAEFEVSAGSSSGGCTVELWVPGNMNLEWRLDFEVRPGVRDGYGRAEAEFLADRLFRALLDRDPEESGRRQAVAEIQAGDLEAQVQAIVRSPEFQRKHQDKDAVAMLEQIYRGLFDRDPDPGAVRAYLTPIRNGEYADAVLKIVRSPEFEDQLARQ